MKESQSVSKMQKSDCDSGRDRLSDLPLSIIHTILSSLPIEDAVRTSILSRQWRYTWTSLPKLEFISNAEGNQDEITASEERLKEFISYALSVHKGSLHKFRLGGVFNEPCPNMDEWLIRLSTKDIRELSDLPLSIIHTILSSLPIEEAVRTSILSRQWRYTWTSLPELEFISNAEEYKDEKTASEERLKEFITYALSVHKGSLHKFRLDWALEEPFPLMDEWLIRLSTKDIRELMLINKFHSFQIQSVHSSIYSCNKLTCLHLFRCDVGPPPSTFKGFSFLKNLTLRRVKISNATFESLVSNSPLLETLHLSQLTKDGKNSMIRVHAPNLKFFHLQGYWTEMSMNAPLLAEMRVVLAGTGLQRVPFYNYTNFLGGCTNLEKLVGLFQFTQVMSMGMESWNPNPLVFHRLRTIALYNVDFLDVKQQSVLARLLVGAPNLQNLILVGKVSLETRDANSSGFGFEPNFRMEKLRFVEMDRVRGILPEIKLIELLLERSPLLETMTVLPIKRLGTEGIKDLSDKILGCTQASHAVNISVSAGLF